jgi:opacity protein-like surface antigen
METDMSRKSLHLTLLALAAAAPTAAMAELEMFAPERVGRWYIGGGIGGFNEEDNAQVANPDNQFGLGFSGGYRLTKFIGLEADGLFSYQEFDTPPSAGGTRRSDLYSNGVSGVVKLFLPLNRVELYAGGGIGVYRSWVDIDGPLLETDADDTNIGYQLLAGADFFVSRRISIGVEYRRLELEADFGSTLPGGKIDTGGDFLFATVRGYF